MYFLFDAYSTFVFVVKFSWTSKWRTLVLAPMRYNIISYQSKKILLPVFPLKHAKCRTLWQVSGTYFISKHCFQAIAFSSCQSPETIPTTRSHSPYFCRNWGNNIVTWVIVTITTGDQPCRYIKNSSRFIFIQDSSLPGHRYPLVCNHTMIF